MITRRRSVSLRPVSSDDSEFLFRVFRLSHGAELDEQLCRLQFQARDNQYRTQYPSADYDVIMDGNEAIGYVYALRGPDAFALVDIALLPESQGTGIGSQLVGELIELAHAVKKPLRAHVLKHSPAWRLWQRLGFRQVSDDGIYLGIEI